MPLEIKPAMNASNVDPSGGEWVELMGEDLVMKVISTSGVPDDDANSDADADAAEVGDAIRLDFTGRQLLCFDDDDCGSQNELQFVKKSGCLIALGDGDVCPGLEMAARFLPSGHRAIVKCRSKYAFGAGGRRAAACTSSKDLPPNADVVFDVCVKGITPSSQLLQDDKLKIELAASKKQLGNECYQYEWDDHGMGKARALKLYGKARDAMIDLLGEIQTRQEEGNSTTTAGELDDDKKRAASVLIDCLNNISAVHLKAKAYGKAKESAATVLQYDPNNTKALCRAARAAIFDPNGTFEECEMAIAAAEEIESDNADVKRLRVELDRRKKQHKKREKAMYSKMMNSNQYAPHKKDTDERNMQTKLQEHEDEKKPSIYLYLFASFFITIGSLILFELVARANTHNEGHGDGVDAGTSSRDQDL